MKTLNIRSILIWTIFAFCLMFVVGGALAQTDVPAVNPVQGELEAALLALMKLVSNVTFIPGAAALVIALTALLKRILPAAISAGAIAITLQVIVWVIYIVAKHFGYADQFNSYLGIVTTIVTALGGLVVSTYVADKGYQKLNEKEVPFLGTSRDDKAA